MKDMEYLQLREKHDKAKKRKFKDTIVKILGFILSFPIFYFIIHKDYTFKLLLCIFEALIATSIIYFIYLVITKKDEVGDYKEAYRNYFIVPALKKRFDNLVYKPTSGFGKRIIASVKMIYNYDEIESNNYIDAQYKGVKFKNANVKLIKEHVDLDSANKKYYDNIFDGRWLIFYLGKSFENTIYIIQKKFGYRVMDLSRGDLINKKNLKKIKVDSEEFNKNFSVYVDNEKLDNDFFDSQIIEKFLQLNQLNEEKMLFCFTNNRLHVILDEPWDDVPESKELSKEQSEQAVNKQIEKITMIVDELQLYNDLY